MSQLLLERAQGLRGEDDSMVHAPGSDVAELRHGLTLDELIISVWEGLTVDGTASCPACGGAMAPRYAAGSRAVGGVCSDCSAELS